MAIGLGKMLGFNFKENFNYPYISKSVRDFWRRWHISLSTWFRDYLYFPIGGNRKGNYRTYFNLVVVFFITGLWHGASWNFVVWGLYHGLFLLMERVSIISLPKKFDLLKRLYLLMVVMVGWVFFRAENLTYAITFIAKMFNFSGGENNTPLIYMNLYSYFIIGIGLLFATPIRKVIENKIRRVVNERVFKTLSYSFYLTLFVITVAELAQATYNPFIYFRF
jgi:alginate O-acetyltransferase complex protein AlgI